MSRPIERVLARLAELSGRQPRRCGAGWMAVCCGHKGGREETESLSVAEAEDGKVLLNCHAEGCSYALIVAGLGMDEAELFPPREGPSGREKRASLSDPKVTLAAFAEFLRLPVRFLEEEGLENQAGGVSLAFRDEAGRHLFRKIRGHLTDKKLKYRYERGLAPGVVCPYGLWDLPQAREAGYLVLVEGETDRLTLKHHGIHALGMPGAATADKLEASHLRGIKTLHVVQEPGAAGELFVSKVAERLAAVGWGGDAFALRMSREQKDPSAMHKADPKSFKARFRELYQRSMRLDAPKVRDMFATLADVEDQATEFLWWPYLIKGGLNIVMGAPGEGKGQTTMAIAAAITTGAPFPGSTAERPPGNVMIFSPEDNIARVVAPRFRRAGGDPKRAHVFKFSEHDFTFNEDDRLRLEAAMDELDPEAVFFDPWAHFSGGVNTNDGDRVCEVLRPMSYVFERRNRTGILVAHTKKGMVPKALEALSGNTQVGAIVRSVVGIYPNPKRKPTPTVSHGLWTHVKHNYSPQGETLCFTITNGEDNFSRFEWSGTAGISAQDIASGTNGNGHHHGNGAGGGDGAAATEEAVELLRRLFLSTGQEQPSLNAGDVQRLAREAGVSRVALDRARARLGIENRWEGAGSASRILWYPAGGAGALRGEEGGGGDAASEPGVDEEDNASNQPGDGSEVPF